MYTQGDKRWADKRLGASRLTVGAYGCLSTALAQALTLAGYGVDPGAFVDAMNKVGGYTVGGLLIWGKLDQAFPQLHIDKPNGDSVHEGRWNGNTHWVLQKDGMIYDPWYGKNEYPKGFIPTKLRTLFIDPPKGVDVMTKDQLIQFVSDANGRTWYRLHHGQQPSMESITREATDIVNRYLGGERYVEGTWIDSHFDEVNYK